MSVFTTLAQSQEIANAVIDKVKNKGYALASDLGDLAALDEVAESNLASALATKINNKLDEADLPSYTVKQQETAEFGYSATYQLYKVTGTGLDEVETAVGAKINIPKDMVVSAGEVKTVTTADVPYQGAVVGDKYIDLTIANAQQSHLYIPVSDLVDIYTEGNGIDITNNAVSVVVDSSNARGLAVGANGLSLALVTASTGGAGGTAGAMSPTDKEKLDNADVTAYTGGNGIDVSNHSVSAVVDSTNANGLSVGANGLAISTATQSAAGAMSAADKTKLDGADVTAYTPGNGVAITNHEVTAVIDGTNANGLSVGASGIALAAATQSAAGAMSASDKTKLDDITVATEQQVEDAIAALDDL